MRIYPLFTLLFGIASAGDLGVLHESEQEPLKVGEDDSTHKFQPRESLQWPRPRSGYVKRTNDWVCLKQGITFTEKSTLPDSDAAVIKQVTADLTAMLAGTNQDGDCQLGNKGGSKVAKLIESITVNIENTGVALLPEVDESYTVELAKDATNIDVSAATVWGARHAITTLTNMLEVRNFSPESAAAKAASIPSADKSHHYIFPYSAFKIDDGPRLGHRGVMMDTSRSYQPISTIQRTIRTMAMAKLNVLHIHATDDQSFPLLLGESSTDIHGKGCPKTGPEEGAVCAAAYSNHHIYKEQDVKDLVAYGMKYGVRVLIEIDQPAHARSWASTTKDLRDCDGLEHQTSEYCAEPICGPLSLNKNYDNVQKLANKITDDWLKVQSDPLMHYGMDEVLSGCWGEEQTETLSMKYLKDAVTYLHKKDPKRRMVVWQDGISPKKHQLPTEVAEYKVIAQVWNDPTVAESLVAQGTDIIWSSSEAMYLDCGRGNPAVANYTSWCSPYKTWWTIYKETPDLLLKSSTDAADAGRVLGGEVALWAEQANAEIFDSLLWPRAAAWGGAAWEARSDIVKDPISDEEIAALYESEYELRKFTNMIVIDGTAATAQYTEWCVFEDKAMCDHYSRAYFGPDGPEVTTTTTATCSAVQRVLGAAIPCIVFLLTTLF